MGGSVNLQGGGQYQMPGAGYAGAGGMQGEVPTGGNFAQGPDANAINTPLGTNMPSSYGSGYAGMQGSVNAPQTADQYAATFAARQPQQTYPRGPISFNPFTGEPEVSYDGGTGTDTSNPWTGTAAPVQAPYYGYGTSTGGKGMQTSPMMTASEATAYAPMNIPNMSFARPQFYYPSISNQMAFMRGLGGMGMGLGGYGGFGGGMGYGGYMGMPGYFSGLGAMGSYMPMMMRSYPSASNRYPGLGPVTAYQPRDPSRPTAYSPPTTQRPAYRPPYTPPTTPVDLNPDLNPVSPSLKYISSPDRSDARPDWADPLLPVRRTGPANAAITGTATAVQVPYPDVLPPDVPSYPATPPMLKNQPEPPYTPPLFPSEPQYTEPTLTKSPFTPPVETPEPELGPPPAIETPPVETPVYYEDTRPDTGLARGQDPFTANVFEP